MNIPEIVGWGVLGLLALAVAAAALVAVWFAANVVWRLVTPDHWVFLGPRFGRARPWSVLARSNALVAGRTGWRHPKHIRRLAGFGPFVIWAVHYAPGKAPEPTTTREDLP